MRIKIEVTQEEIDDIYGCNFIFSEISGCEKSIHMAGDFLEFINDELILPATNVYLDLVEKPVT